MSRAPLLLVFGMRGTLLERLHHSKVPQGMPPATYTVGTHRIWMRRDVLPTLEALKSMGCAMAIWSSTTRRNTDPLVQQCFQMSSGEGSTSDATPFEFVWSREQTIADDYRRSIIVDPEDEHATIKDLNQVWSKETPLSFFINKERARQWTPERTVLIEDTASKGRTCAGNLLVLPTCSELEIASEYAGMERLKEFVATKLLDADDVRTILPYRL